MTNEDIETVLAKVAESMLPLDFEPHESQTIKDAAILDRRRLAARIAAAQKAALTDEFGSLRVEYSAYENSAVGISEQGKEMIESRNINSIWYRRLVSGWKKE